MGVEHKPNARTKVIEALSELVAVNPDLVAGVVVFTTMIDGSVLTLYTCCCARHAAAVAEVGLNQAAEATGWQCPREG